MGVRGASTFPSRNRLPYPFSLVVRPLFCFVVCWHSLPFQDKYVSGDSVNFRGSDIIQLQCKYDRINDSILTDTILVPHSKSFFKDNPEAIKEFLTSTGSLVQNSYPNLSKQSCVRHILTFSR